MPSLELSGPDPRHWDDAAVLRALQNGEPLALAEALHRTVGGLHGAAWRLLGESDGVEALLRTTYTRLWLDPPDRPPLEAAVRRLGFELAGAPSLPPPTPGSRTWRGMRRDDPTTRALATLDDDSRVAVLLAHDAGMSAAQQGEHAHQALTRGLMLLGGGDRACDRCGGVAGLADWVLGLLTPVAASEVAATMRARPDCRDCLRALRRGRLLLAGLPPPPDLLARVLVTAVTRTRRPPPGQVAAATVDATPPAASSAREAGTEPEPEPEPVMPCTPGRSPRTGLVRSALVLVTGIALGLAAVRLMLALQSGGL